MRPAALSWPPPPDGGPGAADLTAHLARERGVAARAEKAAEEARAQALAGREELAAARAEVQRAQDNLRRSQDELAHTRAELEAERARTRAAGEELLRLRQDFERRLDEAGRAVNAAREEGSQALRQLRESYVLELDRRLTAEHRADEAEEAMTDAYRNAMHHRAAAEERVREVLLRLDEGREEREELIRRSETSEKLHAEAALRVDDLTAQLDYSERRADEILAQLREAEQLVLDYRAAALAARDAEALRETEHATRLADAERRASDLRAELERTHLALARSEQRVHEADDRLQAAARTLSGLQLRVANRARGGEA